MIEQRFSNIWDALEDTPEAAENMKSAYMDVSRRASFWHP